MSASHVPPGWPAQVRPAGTPDWERSATGWLLDQCPAEYRGHGVLVRQPRVLAWLAGLHVQASADAARTALGRARADLADAVTASVVAGVVEALEQEVARLIAVRRGVSLVEQALRGQRYVPRL